RTWNLCWSPSQAQNYQKEIHSISACNKKFGFSPSFKETSSIAITTPSSHVYVNESKDLLCQM
ncbi:MAG: hypothetical protein MI674_00050, partial [Cytophagales bacterium]|nr:hypothetical protein [Cytophagales bacterium]